MADIYLKTRIALKYDTLAQWEANDTKLLKGEIAVVAVELSQTAEQVKGSVPPQILFKVGDGTNTFNNLPWASGMAADVYDWAKAETKPGYSASEISGLTEFIQNVSDIDTNTTYQVIAGKSGKAGMYQLQKKDIGGQWADEGAEFGIDEQEIKNLISTAQEKANSAYSLAEGKADKATTLAGYKISDAKIENGVITLGGNTITPVTDISGKADKTTVEAIDGRLTTAEGEIDTLQSGKLGKTEKAADSAKLEGKTKAEVIEEARTGYATTGYVDNKVAGSVQYLGLASKLSDLDVNAGKGDFYRASADFDVVSSGDLIVSLKDEVKTQTIDTTNFAVVKSSDDYQGTVKSVAGKGSNGITVTGGPITETGTLTVAHDAGTAASKAKGFYKISTDAGSHVASVETVGASDITTALGYTPYNATNPNGYTTNKGTVTSVSGTDGLKGSVTTSGSLSVDFDIVAKKTDLPTVNNGEFTVKGDGTSITGTGSMTANQAGNTEATLAVADYTNIISAKNANAEQASAGALVTEGGDTIIFCCGNSTIA